MLIIGIGAATPVNLVNLSIERPLKAEPALFRCFRYFLPDHTSGRDRKGVTDPTIQVIAERRLDNVADEHGRIMGGPAATRIGTTGQLMHELVDLLDTVEIGLGNRTV